MLFISTIISLICGLCGIVNTLFPTFGHSILVALSFLSITYTKLGRIYYSNIFRSMLIFLLLIEIIAQIDVYMQLDAIIYYRTVVSALGLSILFYLFSKLRWHKKK